MRQELEIRRLRSPAELRRAAASMAASDPWLKLGIPAKGCLLALSGPGMETYAAFIGGERAGHTALTMGGLLSGYVRVMFVEPAFRGRGVGEALLRHAERRIFRDSPNVFLCVSSFNGGARRFYRRLGYARAGLLRDLLVKGADELLLRKTRGPRAGYKGKR